jgi:peptidoglycan/xylan/chitin deacetylase (PgdA/CDA1 family)
MTARPRRHLSGPTGHWPAGPGLAVYVAIGVEAYREGTGQTEDIIPGVPAPDHVNAAWREYGNRVGAFRLLETLETLGIPPTVLLNTMVYDEAPQVTDAARSAGAEIVAHGISNSDSLTDLTVTDEDAYLEATAARIATEEGQRPGGWSSPWLAHTPHTIDLLAKTGYRYLLDLRSDDQPVWLPSASGPLLAIPYALELNDSSTMIGRQMDPAPFADAVIDEFEELLTAGEDRPIVMSVVLHSFISGAPFRLRQVRRALAHIAANADQVWLTQPAAIHDAFHSLAPPSDAVAPATLPDSTLPDPRLPDLESVDTP